MIQGPGNPELVEKCKVMDPCFASDFTCKWILPPWTSGRHLHCSHKIFTDKLLKYGLGEKAARRAEKRLNGRRRR